MKTMKFKTTEAMEGRLFPQAPNVPAGMSRDGRVATYAVTDVPDGIPMSTVMRLIDNTCMWGRFLDGTVYIINGSRQYLHVGAFYLPL